jgi:hypothetical protein
MLVAEWECTFRPGSMQSVSTQLDGTAAGLLLYALQEHFFTRDEIFCSIWTCNHDSKKNVGPAGTGHVDHNIITLFMFEAVFPFKNMKGDASATVAFLLV